MQDLTEITRKMLHDYAEKVMIKQIAADFNISKEWLYKFYQGKIDGDYKTSEEKIKYLYECLVSKLNSSLS